MRKARIKRQTSTHVFVCQRPCSSFWIRQLYKAANFVIEIPSGQAFCPHDMHEPLLAGILFPFLMSRPCQVRNTPKMYAMGSSVRRLLKNKKEMDVRDLLRKFLGQVSPAQNHAGKCGAEDVTHPPPPEIFTADPDNLFAEEGNGNRLVTGWKPKSSDQGRYRHARNGDDLMVAFEYDFCVFSKVYERPPDLTSPTDKFGMACIRRVTLDAFWSRSRATVASSASRFREIIRNSALLGFEPP